MSEDNAKPCMTQAERGEHRSPARCGPTEESGMNRTITAMILAATIGAAPAASIACPEDGHDDPEMAKCIQSEKIKNPGITTNEARGNCQGLLSGDGIGRNSSHAPDPGPVYPPAPAVASGGNQQFVPSGDPFVDCLNRASQKYTQMGLSQMEVRAKRDAECGNLGNSAPSTGPVYPPAPAPAPSQPERVSNEDPNAYQQCIRQHVENGRRSGMSHQEAHENAKGQCRK